ncbi:MAG: radical SAM protein, partial [Candidatus Adiutrix sp.]
IIKVKALESLLENSNHHAPPTFIHQPQNFKINRVNAEKTAPGLRVSLDFAADINLVNGILKNLDNPGNTQIIDFINKNILWQPKPQLKTQEVGLSKVLLFPDKLASLKNNSPQGCDFSYPISVELSLTNECNQHCSWCSDFKLRQKSPDRLNLEILKNLFSDLAQGGSKGVTIEGGGEPTLAPFFAQTVKAACQQNLAVGLITNGLQLFDQGEDIFGEMQWVRVSLDAANGNQYLKLKKIDGFGLTMKNIEKLVKIAPKAAIGVGYVLSKHNDDPDGLQHLLLTLRSMGVSYIQIRPVVDHPSLVSHLNLDYLQKVETADFSVNISALTDNQSGGNMGLPCLAHSLSSVIGADGAVWLCGRLNTDPLARPLGSLLTHSFSEIWHGDERAKQVAQAFDPTFCKQNCPQCRMSKYNRLLTDIAKIKTKNFI